MEKSSTISNAEWALAKRRARVAARPVQHTNPVPNPECQGPARTPPSDRLLACSVPASGVGSVDGPAVYWVLEKSVYSLIENVAAKRQSLLVNGQRQQTPDKARMLTGRDALSGFALFVAPKVQGMVS
jgi:hypothetical protein